ncbi:hypothetical protein C0995_007044, partial [Termitomyces sp. Mi166
MADAPAMQQGHRVEVLDTPVMGSQAGPSSQGEACLAPEISELKAQPVAVESRGLSAFLHALDVPGPTKHHQGQKPPLDLSKLDVIDFPDNRPNRTAAASKGKGKAVAMIKDESDYGQFFSEDKQESEDELAAQRFQLMQQNKKLTTKKANVAKAEAALQHRAINDFSGCIPDRLGVKVWGLLDVEQLN